MRSRQFHLYLYGPDRGPIESSFEAAAERLEQLKMLHFEPDGSFVWSRDQGKQQVFGMLYDANDQIQYAEMRGDCQQETWQMLVAAICGPSIEGITIMQLPQRALQDLQDFETFWVALDNDLPD